MTSQPLSAAGPGATARPAGQPPTVPPSVSPPSPVAVAAGFDAYAAAFETGGAPLLGHVVMYSVFDGRVKRTDLENWFRELGLDAAFLPPPIRQVDAFEKITGRDGMRRSYPLDGQRPVLPSGKRPRRPVNGRAREASLMVRHVRRDPKVIVRHLVREVRDETLTKLSYHPRVAELVFTRDLGAAAPAGAGSLAIDPEHKTIAGLPEAERAVVKEVLDELADTYAHRCAFYTADRLRTLIRGYVEHLGAVRVRSTGGVYFVHRAHTDTLAALRTLVARMGQGSNLVRIPIPDQDEMREMIIAAFTSQAKDELDQLARDIAAAHAARAPEHEVSELYRRFTGLQKATAQHAELLSTTLDDTDAALKLVNLQLAGLLAGTGDDDQED